MLYLYFDENQNKGWQSESAAATNQSHQQLLNLIPSRESLAIGRRWMLMTLSPIILGAAKEFQLQFHFHSQLIKSQTQRDTHSVWNLPFLWWIASWSGGLAMVTDAMEIIARQPQITKWFSVNPLLIWLVVSAGFSDVEVGDDEVDDFGLLLLQILLLILLAAIFICFCLGFLVSSVRLVKF